VQLQRNTQRNTQDNNSSGNQSEFQDFQHSKRENNSNKIYERGLTPQVGMNPFLQGNYLQDLETQNEFLKPINSNNGLRTNDLSGSDQNVISKNV
jgi:hypothetical protein